MTPSVGRTPAIQDAKFRPLRDLRISLTDRCNFRCRYCMPREIFGPNYPFLASDETLSIEEILRVTRLLASLGVEKVRLTGGEPLLRRNLPEIIRAIRDIDGIKDIALTTNGSLLTNRRATALATAGLKRITISLDAIEDEIFSHINDVGFPVKRVLAAVSAAQDAGLSPVKVNMVVRHGDNESQIIPMVEQFRGTGVILRFIEYMDVGSSNGWRLDDVVSATEIHDTIAAKYPLQPVPPRTVGEVATRFEFADGQGEIGLIHSVTRPFCGGCTRLRLTADGDLFTCLFGTKGTPLKSRLRDGTSDELLERLLASVWRGRKDQYSVERSAATLAEPRVEMSRIGG